MSFLPAGRTALRIAPVMAALVGAGALARSGVLIAAGRCRRMGMFSPGLAASDDGCQQAACRAARPSSAATGRNPASAMANAIAHRMNERLLMMCAIEDRRRLVQSAPDTEPGLEEIVADGSVRGCRPGAASLVTT